MTTFDTPASRATDPQTSKDAEAEVNLLSRNKWCRLVLWAMVERENRGADGSIPTEIITRLSLRGEPVPETSSITRRLTDLERRGYVTVAVGEDGERTRLGGNGRNQRVRLSTAAGREALTDALREGVSPCAG